MIPPDFQHSSQVFIVTKPLARYCLLIASDNLMPVSINFAVRHVFEHTWINHNDQFLYPNGGYKSDTEFQNNCLVYTLFHGKNTIQSHYGVNHWIPFTEKEIGAGEKFESNFMSGFLKGRTLSGEAAAVLDAGRELWKYYHAKTRNDKTASVNTSFYDIRAHFQGRKVSGNMNTKSTDETYNALLAALRGALKTLTLKIQPKVYEYGFLKE